MSSTGSSSTSDNPGGGDSHFLTSDQYAKFLNLIEKQSVDESAATANMAGTSVYTACSSFVQCNSSTGSPNCFQNWVVDSNANQHMVASETQLRDTVDVSKLDLFVNHPNGSSAKIKTIGNCSINSHLTLFDVFVVPDFNINLLSVHKICKDSRYEVVFNEHSFTIQDFQSKEMVENGSQKGGLYYLNNCNSGNNKIQSNLTKCYISKITWHSRLGHPNDQALNSLKDKLKFGNINLPPCEVCHKAKQTRESFSLSEHITTKLGDLVHLDVWGPYKITSVGGYRFFLTVVDDFTRATWVYLLKSKDEVFFHVQIFLNVLQHQLSLRSKLLEVTMALSFLTTE